MQLPEIAIRRPVFATVLSLLVLLIGAVSFNRLAVREYPKIDEPVVTVSVRYPGASAEVIESQVTKPLEDSIAGIDAIDVLSSISRAEQTQISVRFRLEKDADAAAAEVRDRTSRVRNRLPQAIDEPVIAKVEADAFPVIWLAFTSDTLNPLQVNDLVNRIVKPRLQTVTGVADVRIFSGPPRCGQRTGPSAGSATCRAAPSRRRSWSTGPSTWGPRTARSTRSRRAPAASAGPTRRAAPSRPRSPTRRGASSSATTTAR